MEILRSKWLCKQGRRRFGVDRYKPVARSKVLARVINVGIYLLIKTSLYMVKVIEFLI